MLFYCIEDLRGYELLETSTEEWTDAVDRGGLCHVNDHTYRCFYLMKIEITNHLVARNATDVNDGTKSNIMNALLENNNLNCH
jgi:hypothetical protein